MSVVHERCSWATLGISYKVMSSPGKHIQTSSTLRWLLNLREADQRYRSALFPFLIQTRTSQSCCTEPRLQCGMPCISSLSLCGVNKPPLPPLPWTQFPCSFHCFYCWQTMKIWSRNEDKNLTNLSDFSINWIVLPAWNANTWVFL